MTPRSPSAFTASLSLHALVVALVLVWTFIFRAKPPPAPHVFELVAGEGNNWGATEAAARGTETATSAKNDLAANLNKVINRAASKTKAKLDRQERIEAERQRKADEAAAKAAAAAAAAKARQDATKPQSYQDFLNKNGSRSSPSTTTPKATPVQVRHVTGISGGVDGGSTAVRTAGAGGTALSAPAQAAIDAYINLYLSRVHDACDTPAGLSDQTSVTIQFSLGSDGRLLDLTVLSGSGNAAYDKAVLAAFRRVVPIGAPPGGGGTWSAVFQAEQL